MNAPQFRHAINEQEKAILESCDAVLDRHVGMLREAGLEACVRRISDLPHVGADVTIDFVGTGGVEDVLEFRIARDGAPTVQAGELTAWLEAELPKIGGSGP